MKILFFSPYAEYNGAEMNLSYLIAAMDKEIFQGEIFTLRNGGVFAHLDIPHHTPDLNVSFAERVKSKIVRRRKSEQEKITEQLLAIQNCFKADLWYFNTINLPDYIFELGRKLSVKTVVHFHELPYYYHVQSWSSLESIVKSADGLIACSQRVYDNLKIMGGDRVDKLYEFINSARIKVTPGKREEIRKSLGINEDEFVWGMAGGAYYRKGTDFIPPIFEKLDSSHHLMWIGSLPPSGYNYFVSSYIQSKNLKNIHFVGSQNEDYYNYLNACDGFLLTSREDPFPLVMIEAAALGKPLVGFDSGGISEFVREGMGLVVNSWKILDIIDAMNKIRNGEIALSAEAGKERSKEFSIDKKITEWEEIMKSL